MSGVVQSLFECPKCNTPMSSSEKPERCPKCKFRFAKFGEELSKEFSWEKSPDRQYFELVQQDMERFLDKPLTEIGDALGMKIEGDKRKELEEMTLSNANRKKIIEDLRSKERDLFMMKTSPDEIEGWVKSIHYLMTLAVPSGNKELIAQLAVWGAQIGKMSKTLLDYLNSAGAINEYSLSLTEQDINKLKEELEYETSSASESGDSQCGKQYTKRPRSKST